MASVIVAAGLLVGPPLSAAAGAGESCTLDRLPMRSHAPYIEVTAIDPTGRWIVAQAGAYDELAFLWDNKKRTLRARLGLYRPRVYDVSESGTLVGAGYREATYNFRGFAIKADGTRIRLDGIGPKETAQARPMGITKRDVVYGVATTKHGYGIARWSLTKPDKPRLVVPVPDGYTLTRVYVSPKGLIAATGWQGDVDEVAAWWWDDQREMHQLVAPDGRASITLAGFSGRHAVGHVDGAYAAAVRWDLRAGDSMWLPNDPYYESQDINGHGQIAASAWLQRRAVLVDERDVTLLEEIIRYESRANAVSDNGTVAGTVHDPLWTSDGQVPVRWHCI